MKLVSIPVGGYEEMLIWMGVICVDICNDESGSHVYPCFDDQAGYSPLGSCGMMHKQGQLCIHLRQLGTLISYLWVHLGHIAGSNLRDSVYQDLGLHNLLVSSFADGIDMRSTISKGRAGHDGCSRGCTPGGRLKLARSGEVFLWKICVLGRIKVVDCN